MRVRRLAVIAAAVAIVATLAFGGGSWYYADTLESGALDVGIPAPDYNVTVVGITASTVTLTADSEGDWSHPGTWGLEWPGGYAQITTIHEQGDGRVTRDLTAVEGTLQPGQQVRVDRFAFHGDPMQAFGIPFEEVTYQSDVGEFGAWLVRGDPTTWAIFVHGRRTERAEALRLLPAVYALGYTELVIDYRNDPGSPGSADGYYDYGDTEWHDLDGAASYAFAHGATRLVLAGLSMGGGVVAAFLERSQLAPSVVAVILDAPMLDFGSTIDFQAARRHIPGPVTRFSKWLSARRFGIDWDALNYIDAAASLRAPILLFHGTNDGTVPIETSDRLAALRPDLVTYVRVEGAPHVGSWNIDPAKYEAALREFLLRAVR